MDYGMVAAGLVLLVLGGEVLLRGALGLSARFGVSPAVIGAVVMGFGTSTPELAASVTAVFNDYPGIALGNVIGSNVANVALILGVTMVVSPFMARLGRVEVLALVGATLALAAVIAWGRIGAGLGAVLLAGLAGYLVASLRAGSGEGEDALPSNPTLLSFGFVAAGLIGLVAGAQILVAGAVGLAESFGVPPSIVGLTVVAVGTSLPELAASLSAALRGQGAMALGNVVGSNIFNALGILGVTAVLHPIAVPLSIGAVDVAVLTACTVALLALAWVGRFGRIAGLAALAGYAGYTAYLVT